MRLFSHFFVGTIWHLKNRKKYNFFIFTVELFEKNLLSDKARHSKNFNSKRSVVVSGVFRNLQTGGPFSRPQKVDDLFLENDQLDYLFLLIFSKFSPILGPR
jgi:hypothetical protein